MHPVLFKIGDFSIGMYGIMIVLGMLAGLWVSRTLAKRQGIRTDFFYDLTCLALLSGFIGARVFYILTNWAEFMANPLALLLSRQGFVFLGGFVVALASCIWFTLRRGVPLFEAADIVGPALAIAHALGRVGCFLAGCCYGTICTAGHGDSLLCRLSVQYPLVRDSQGLPEQMFNFAYWSQLERHLIDGSATRPLPIFPVQLLESAGNLLIFVFLFRLWSRRKFSGQVFMMYLALYGVLRFVLEFFRGDVERGLYFNGLVSTSQIISLLTIVAALVLWRVRRNVAPAPAMREVAIESAHDNPADKVSQRINAPAGPARKRAR